MPYENLWHERVASAIEKPLNATTFAAFNVCIDAIVHFKPAHLDILQESVGAIELVDDVRPQLVETRAQFLSILVSALRMGKSLQCILDDGLAQWFDETFVDRKEEVGGQAGIIANLMASLEAGSILYAPLMSPRQAAFFSDDVEFPVVRNGALALEQVSQAAEETAATKVNWIFEYAKGDVFEVGGEAITVPRANRVIFATRPSGLTMAFEPSYVPYLGPLASHVDVGFIAGYHNVSATMPDGRSALQYMDDEEANLGAMLAANPDLKLHLEYVTPKSAEFEIPMLERATRYIKSFGINENEIKLVLDRYGRAEELEGVKQCECAASLYRAGRALLDALNVDRIHIHNLGYYVMVCRTTPETTSRLKDAQVNGCLYATAAVSVKALYGGFATPDKLREVKRLRLSEIGFSQMTAFAQEFGLGEDFMETGIADMGDHYAILTPAFIVDRPVSTVGMGDTISSTSFTYEVSMMR